jgi:hypothetical protein
MLSNCHLRLRSSLTFIFGVSIHSIVPESLLTGHNYTYNSYATAFRCKSRSVIYYNFTVYHSS